MKSIKAQVSDEDAMKLATYAAERGIQIPELIECFIGDLIGGKRESGPDSVLQLKKWASSCYFNLRPADTFVSWAINKEILDIIKTDYFFIQESEFEIKNLNDESKIMQIKDDVSEARAELINYYKEYVRESKNPQSYDDEMEYMEEWFDSFCE